MPKLIAVFGATGQQGSSMINHILNDLELSLQYDIRAITRDPGSSHAHKLPKNIEIYRAVGVTPRGAARVLSHGFRFLLEPLSPRTGRRLTPSDSSADRSGFQLVTWKVQPTPLLETTGMVCIQNSWQFVKMSL